MSIIRAPRPQSHFTQIRNDVARNGALSFRARGVLTYILSMPDDWRTTSEDLAKHAPEGRDAIRSALSELEAAGHLVRARIRGADGRFTTTVTVYDEPIPVADRPQPESRKRRHNGPTTESPVPVEPTPDNPSSVSPAETHKTAGQADDGLPVVGFLGVLQNTVEEHYENTPPTPPRGERVSEGQEPLIDVPATTAPAKRRSRSSDDPEFVAFWKMYPRGDAKADALKAFIATVDKQRVPVSTIMVGLERSMSVWQGEGRPLDKVPYAASWLRGKRWEDEGARNSWAPPADDRPVSRPSAPVVSYEDRAEHMWEVAAGDPSILVGMLNGHCDNNPANLAVMVETARACYERAGIDPGPFDAEVAGQGIQTVGAVA